METTVVGSLSISKENSEKCVMENEWAINADWKALHEEALGRVFSFLDYQDRVRAACVCKTWQSIAASPALWKVLELRLRDLTPKASKGLSARFSPLVERLVMWSGNVPEVSFLRLDTLRSLDIHGESPFEDCHMMMLLARVGSNLRSLAIRDCISISSTAIETLALCCPQLQVITLHNLQEMSTSAFAALSRHCPHLTQLSILDCKEVASDGLSFLKQLQFLSLAGSKADWAAAITCFLSLPVLKGLDVSLTTIDLKDLNRLMTSRSLRVLCALGCNVTVRFHSRVTLVAEKNAFRALVEELPSLKYGVQELSDWTESMLVHTLQVSAEREDTEYNDFWPTQGVPAVLHLIQSRQPSVRDSAADAASFMVIEDSSRGDEGRPRGRQSLDQKRASAFLQGGGVGLLVRMAAGQGEEEEGCMFSALHALRCLSTYPPAALQMLKDGVLPALVGHIGSSSLLLERAMELLQNLSVHAHEKAPFVAAGGIQVLVGVLLRACELPTQSSPLRHTCARHAYLAVGAEARKLGIAPYPGEKATEEVLKVLEDLVKDDTCKTLIVRSGVLPVLVRLLRLGNERIKELATSIMETIADLWTKEFCR